MTEYDEVRVRALEHRVRELERRQYRLLDAFLRHKVLTEDREEPDDREPEPEREGEREARE